MARLVTCGFEVDPVGPGVPAGIDGNPESGVAKETTIVRSGAASARCNTAAAIFFTAAGQVTGNATNYGRAYIYLSGLPASTLQIVRWESATINSIIQVRLTAAGKLQIAVNAVQLGSDSAVTLTANTWYRLETSVTLNASSIPTATALRIDGSSQVSGSVAGATGATTGFVVGFNASPGFSLYIDDVAVNDSTGASQNSWPDEGKIVLLRPTADSAAGTGWTLGTGTAPGGNGFAAVDNTPPLGVADLAVGSDPKQIRNAAAAANSNYDMTMTTYTAAGLVGSDTINVVVACVSTGAPVSTGAKLGTVGVVSNPVIANVALGSVGTAGAFWQGNAAGTYRAGWKPSFGTSAYAPSVTLGTAPVMRITQVTSSTRIAIVCFMGIYVDYTPAAAPAATKKLRALVTPGVTVMRAAAR